MAQFDRNRWRHYSEIANKSGVYIHHCNGKILYIGKTTSGRWGNFAERLRREFQETSSQNSTLYQLLNKQTNSIKTFMLDLNDIDLMINSSHLDKERKALILEQVLIGIFNPKGNKA